jgi:hypothetical protein
MDEGFIAENVERVFEDAEVDEDGVDLAAERMQVVNERIAELVRREVELP